MNPAFLQTYVNAQDIYHLQKQKLQHNLNYIDRYFTNRDYFTYNSTYPIIYFEKEFISKKLFDNKIITTSFKYTNASGKLNRIVITANHTLADLERLITHLS